MDVEEAIRIQGTNRISMSRFQHYVCLDGGAPPVAWDPFSGEEGPTPECAYLGGIMRTVEQRWQGAPLRVYVTKDTQWVPATGDDVVVVLMNDNWFRTPAYSGEVLAVLRNNTARPYFPWSTLWPPNRLALVALANYGRVLAERTLHTARHRRVARIHGWRPPTRATTVEIPLGYFRQPDMPVIPLSERPNDLYFGGSLVHARERGGRVRRALKGLLGSPKQHYRAEMLRRTEAFAAERPEVRAKITISGDLHGLSAHEASSYGEDMMSSRVALVPRGTALESYRLFEAWRYGCVVVCEPLARTRLYEASPRVTVSSWRRLAPTLDALLSDEQRLQDLHQRSLRWWHEVCSEEAVGGRLAAQLADWAEPAIAGS